MTEDEPTTGTATARAPARVLVTGASGFVGRHLVAELAGRGMAVTAAARRRPPAAGGPAGVARVGGDNGASIALHRACGFELVGVEREIGRKFNRWLDVAVLQRMLGGAGFDAD